MERKTWLLVLCLLSLILIANGQKPETKLEVSAQPRYQLISAQHEQDGKMVFVLDAQTGRVWKYQQAGPTQSGFIPDAFVSVGFGIPRVDGTQGSNLKGSASDDTGR